MPFDIDVDKDKDGSPGFDDLGEDAVADIGEDLKDNEEALK